MILLWPLVAVAAGIAGWRRRSQAAGRGFRWFMAWTLAGAMMSFSLLAGFSIGLFVLPLAAAVMLWTVRRSPHAVEAVGLFAGTGIVLLVIAFINRGYTGCPAGGLSIGTDAPAGTAVSCGGLDPHPWLVAGVAFTAAGLALYGAHRLRLARRAGR